VRKKSTPQDLVYIPVGIKQRKKGKGEVLHPFRDPISFSYPGTLAIP
jgi:hypothetical protein